MQVKSQLTAEKILSKISDLDIFKRFISDFKEINRKFKSPFTDEKTGSCSVFIKNGKHYFKDFSSGHGGDCFKFIQLKYNVTYEESLRIIATDFNIKQDLKSVATQVIIQKKSFDKITRIRIKSKTFTQKGLDYWNQYGITKEYLDKYFIKQISHYWVEYTRFHPTFGFAYDFGNNIYKILQPEEDKEWKWGGNLKSFHIQGYHQLPKTGELLIITSSLKDVIVLNMLGYNVIAPSSESTIIPELYIESLKERFNKIIVYFNNDSPGIAYSEKYKKLYNFKYIVNPLEFPKDPSDCVKEKIDLNKLMKELLWDL